MRFIFRPCCVDLCQGDRFAQRGRLACGQSHLILHPVGTEMPRNQTVAQPGPRPEPPAVCELTCVFLTWSFPANKILVVVEEIGTKVLKMCTFLHVNSFMLFFFSPPAAIFGLHAVQTDLCCQGAGSSVLHQALKLLVTGGITMSSASSLQPSDKRLLFFDSPTRSVFVYVLPSVTVVSAECFPLSDT